MSQTTFPITRLAVEYMPRDFPGRLVFSQEIPESLREKIQLKCFRSGVEFHYIDGRMLYLSPRKPGVRNDKNEGLYQVFARKPDSDIIWCVDIVDPALFDRELDKWSEVDRYRNHITRLTGLVPETDFGKVVEIHTSLRSELEAREAEKQAQDAETQRREKEEAEQNHASAMEAAGRSFVQGRSILGEEFCELLKFYGLWEGIHPKTKHYLSKDLHEISRFAYVATAGSKSKWLGEIKLQLVNRLITTLSPLAEENAERQE